MKDVLDCRTVVNFQVALCVTVMSPLGLLLSICATLPIIWRDPGSENVEVVKIVETGVALSHSVLLVSYVFWHMKCVVLYISFNEIHTQSIKPHPLSSSPQKEIILEFIS